MSKVLIGVSGYFSAAHKDRDTGDIHGHTWKVTAKFETCEAPKDARLYKASLDALLKQWDHKTLPDKLAWAEDIAKAVGTLQNCVEVEVARPLEGLYAWWIAS